MGVQEDLPRWNPKHIFAAPDSPDVEHTLTEVKNRSRRLSRDYRDQISILDLDHLVLGIREYESCVSLLQRVSSYAELCYGLHDQQAETLALLTRCDEAWAELATELSFFEQEIAALDKPDNAAFREYEHFVRKVRATSLQQPSGPAGEVLTRLAPTGIDGWQRLAQQLLGRLRVEIDGATQGIGALLPTLYDPDRSVRASIHAAITQALQGELDLRATALSMIAADGEARANLGAPDWLTSRYALDQVDAAEVDTLLAVADECLPVMHDYYALKRDVLGQGELTDYDRYAPIFPNVDPGPFSWSEATTLVIDSFASIDAILGAAARSILAGNCIDAEPRPNKQRKASTRAIPGSPACISMNYTGRLRDVFTLAHEMGHALHLRFAAEQPFFAATPPPVTGETVALFGEAVVAHELMSRNDRVELQAIYLARWLEDQLVAIGRHSALHVFEVGIRSSVRDCGFLTPDHINQVWLDTQRQAYGPAVTFTAGYAIWWSYLSELFIQPGSNYSYIYGQLSALTLLEGFKRDPESFGPRFLDLLRAGDSKPPADLLAATGVQTKHPGCLRQSVEALRTRLTQLHTLVAEAATIPPPPAL